MTRTQRSPFFPWSMAILTMALLTACVSTPPKQATASSSLSSSTKDAVASRLNDDASVVRLWVNARAEYERALEQSTLESKAEYRFITKRRLIDARYFLLIAEQDLLFDIDRHDALNNFDRSRRLIEKALETSAPEEVEKIESILKDLAKMRSLLVFDIRQETPWLPTDQRARFDAILFKIDALIRGNT